MKILLLALALATPADDRPRGGGGGVTGAGDIINDYLYCADQTTDADALDCMLSGSSAYYAAALAHRNGGDLMLPAGFGTKIVEVQNFGADIEGDLYVIGRHSLANGFASATYVARNGGAGAGEFDCDTSVQNCAENLANLLSVGTITGITYSTLACGGNWCVYMLPTDPDTYWIEQEVVDVGPGAVFAVTTDSGTDGVIDFPGLVKFESGLQLPDPNAFVGTQPTCDATTHNILWTDNGGMGTPDDLEWCAWNGAAYAWVPIMWNPSASAAVFNSTLTATGAANLNGGVNTDGDDYTITPATGAVCIYDELGATCGTRTDDASSNNRHVSSSNVYPFATQGTTSPGNVHIYGGLDAKQIYVLDGLAACTAADTVTVVRIINGTSASDTLTYGTHWGTGGGLTATIAATQLAAAIEALSGVGSTASGAQCPGLGAAADRCVGVSADRLTSSVTLSNNDDTCTVESNGVDGSIVVRNGVVGAPAIIGSDADTGWYFTDTPGISGAINGVARFIYTASGLTIAGSYTASGGWYTAGNAILTASTMTALETGNVKTATAKYGWTNAMVVALSPAAETAGDIGVVTLPAKTEVVDMQLIIDTQCVLAAGALTVSVGRTGANYDDYIVDSDAKAAANTVYGDAVGERGTNLVGYDVPSWTATTTVYAHFDGAGDLSDVTACTGHVVITTRLLP